MICIEYSKTHEDLRVLMRYLVLLHCLTEYQKRLEFPLRQGGYDDVFISNLIIFYNKLHFVDIVELRGSTPPLHSTAAKPQLFLGFSKDCGLLQRQEEGL